MSKIEIIDSYLKSKALGYLWTESSHPMKDSEKSGCPKLATIAATSWLPPLTEI